MNALASVAVVALGSAIGTTVSYYVTYTVRAWQQRAKLAKAMTLELRRDMDKFGGQE